MSPAPTAHRSAALLVSLVVSLTLGLGLTACKSTPSADATNDSAQSQPVEVTGPEDLLQTEDTMLSMRLRFGGELPAVMRQISESRDMDKFSELLEDPVTFLRDEPTTQLDLSALDSERPLYVSISSLGNDSFLRAAAMGLPTPMEEWPSHILLRVLLPTDDPALMETQFDTFVAKLNSTDSARSLVARSFEGPGFLRVELAMGLGRWSRPSEESTAKAHGWLERLDLENLAPPSSAAFRPTAAYNAFVNAESELALWTRFESLMTFATFESSQRARNHVLVAPVKEEEKAYFTKDVVAAMRLDAMSDLALASFFTDPIAAENEDISLHADATETGEVFLDAVVTRTAQGARVGEASRASLTLPRVERDAFMALDWAVDLPAIAQTTSAPFWVSETQEHVTPDSDPLDIKAVLARFYGVSNFALLNALTQYPMAMVNTAAMTDVAVPVAHAGTLRGVTLPQGGPLPVGLAGALLFTNESGVRDQLQQLSSLAQRALPVPFDTAIIERDDTLLELRVALGGSVAELFEGAGDIEVSETDFELDLNKLSQLRAMFLAQAGPNAFDRMTFDANTEEGYQSFRVALDAEGDTVARTAENDAPLLTAPATRCRTELAAAAFIHLHEMHTDAHDKATRYLSTMSKRAETCIDPSHPYAAEANARHKLAREWAAAINASPSSELRRDIESDPTADPSVLAGHD